MRKNVDHIKEIVVMQQSYSKLVGVPEKLTVASLVDDALRMNTGAFTRHGVSLKCDFEDVPEIIVEKHKVLQILINLLRNAKYACEASEKPDKQVAICIANQRGRRAHRGHRQRDRHTAGAHDANFQPRLHHQEGRPRLRIAQRRPGGQGTWAGPCASTAPVSAMARRSRSICRSNHRRRLMAKSTTPVNRRILVIDDNPDIHGDFRKVIGGGLDEADALAAAELALLGEEFAGEHESRL